MVLYISHVVAACPPRQIGKMIVGRIAVQMATFHAGRHFPDKRPQHHNVNVNTSCCAPENNAKMPRRRPAGAKYPSLQRLQPRSSSVIPGYGYGSVHAADTAKGRNLVRTLGPDDGEPPLPVPVEGTSGQISSSESSQPPSSSNSCPSNVLSMSSSPMRPSPKGVSSRRNCTADKP